MYLVWDTPADAATSLPKDDLSFSAVMVYRSDGRPLVTPT